MIDSQRKVGKLNKKSIFTPARATTLGFLAVILIGAFLLSLPISHNDGEWFGFTDSLFTATSCVCVTGLAVVDTAIEFTLFGQIVILLLIQIGGLGFMTLATVMFIVFGKKINLKSRIYMQESVSEDNLKGVVRLAQKIVIYTLAFEAMGAFVLSFQFAKDFGVGEGIFKAIFMSVSAFCNAGFDVLGANYGAFSSLAHYQNNPLVLLTLGMLIIMGGLGFAVITDIISRKKSNRLRAHTKAVLLMTSILIVLGTVMFLGFEYNNPKTIGNMSFGNKLLNALFQAITPRTAGFQVLNQADLTVSGATLTMVLMFIGASPASTGGGIKTTTFLIMIAYLWSNLRGEKDLVLNKKQITTAQLKKSVAIITTAVLVIVGSVMVISIAEGVNGNNYAGFEGILFESISAFATVGLSMGITPTLSVVSKLMLCLVMLIGRTGPITMGFALVKKVNKTQVNIKYPNSDIMVG
ncbi:MAG: TrkH family potassium uptake protein [Eubacteriales bacterium]|nr:TrkH family potassium uptake protein [Eubacteriales bacterium]